MSLRREFTHCMVRPGDITPSQDDMEVVGAFNPGVAVVGDKTVLLIRVAESPKPTRAGCVALPHWNLASRRIDFEWVPEEEVIRQDTRSVRFRHNGIVRLTFVSHLCIAWSRDGRRIDSIDPVRFGPESAIEEYGVEDPRITRIGDRYCISYVAISRHGPATMLATTRDFVTFERHGVIFCPDNKDVVFFPEKIGDRYVALHRPSLSSDHSRPEIWSATSHDLLHWGDHEPLRGGTCGWERGRIGAGAPPVKVEKGWLEMYHGNDRRHGEARVGRYSGGLMLFNPEQPLRVSAISDAIFLPETDFETTGFVPDVVFPTALIEHDDLMYVYYGAADTVSAVTAYSRRDLLGALRPCNGT